MTLSIIKVLVLTELRLRLRRLSTLLALLAVIAITWALIPDPAGGSTLSLMSIHRARVLYTSSALALGSGKMAAILFGLLGFYLVRGRVGEDLRSGAGSVIAATPIGDGLFLFGRWLGGVAYLLILVLALAATVVLLHALRGQGPIEWLVYLQTYCTLLLPIVFFSVSCALLCDSTPLLMGKVGDVAYFILWAAQFPALDGFFARGHATLAPWMVFDFTGLTLSLLVLSVKLQVPLSQVSKGFTSFDPALAAVTLPSLLWTIEMTLLRVGSAVLAMVPWAAGVFLFHRFSPDLVKPSSARRWFLPLARINGWLRPLSRLVQPLFRLAAALPGLAGQVLADLALTLAAAPLTIVLLIGSVLATVMLDATRLPGCLALVVLCWGVAVSELSTRDFAAATHELTETVPGGWSRRYLCQWLAASLLGWLCMGGIALRWAAADPLRAVALLSGVLSLSALATLLGHLSRTGRAFLALFLFGWYVAWNTQDVPMLDLVGFNGVADLRSVLTQGLLTVAAGLVAYFHGRRRAG